MATVEVIALLRVNWIGPAGVEPFGAGGDAGVPVTVGEAADVDAIAEAAGVAGAASADCPPPQPASSNEVVENAVDFKKSRRSLSVMIVSVGVLVELAKGVGSI